MGLTLTLIGVLLLVLVIAYVRAHPKPTGEPLTTYVEDTTKAVEQEVVAEVKKVGEEVVTVAKKVTKRSSANTAG